MSFDKNKAMRNAERFLSQGKIRAAINEYQRVVENDPRDFSTLNILGDLYAKNLEKQQAVGCFTLVAEHYNTQGFSHKAIAVYNKISRIEPNMIEVSAKLAELYQLKGSIAEARQHYKTLANHYQQNGQKTEALAIWKQIAELDPNNTEIYLKIAETCLQEEQFDEAAQAFTESGLRLLKQEKFELALASFNKALEIKKDNLRALRGLVKAQINLGCADEAALLLEEILTEQPNNTELLYLLVDCYLEMNNAPKAESAVIKLFELEPANYVKFLELVKLYLKGGDLTAATRVLSMTAEHLLGGGQAEEFLGWVNEILARNPEHVNALRLLARYFEWKHEQPELIQALERLAEAARYEETVEDEHFALSRLVRFCPQETKYAERLQEISAAYGLETEYTVDQFKESEQVAEFEPTQYQDFAASENETSLEQTVETNDFDFTPAPNTYDFEPNGYSPSDSINDVKDFAFYSDANVQAADETNFETSGENSFELSNGLPGEVKSDNALHLQKELDSIEFYIEQGYKELARSALDELEASSGTLSEITEMRSRLNNNSSSPAAETETVLPPVAADETVFAPQKEIVVQNKNAAQVENAFGFDILDELKSELDSEEETADIDDTYETHYQMGTAYKEMGLLDNSIKEFQTAINLVETNDGTRRFFQCANMLGHCFMEKNMPKVATKWFLRDLEVADLTDAEKQAIFYDLGLAYEASGEKASAVSYFEQIYAEDIDYRDVSERLQNLM